MSSLSGIKKFSGVAITSKAKRDVKVPKEEEEEVISEEEEEEESKDVVSDDEGLIAEEQEEIGSMEFTSTIPMLYQIHNTVKDMIMARGYIVPSEELRLMDETKFETYYSKKSGDAKSKKSTIWINLSTEYKSAPPSTKVIYVDYIENVDTKTIGSNIIKPILERIEEKRENLDLAEYILITPKKIANESQQLLLSLEGVKITIFHFTELLFTVTKHFLVPEHVLLNETQKLAVLKSIFPKNPTAAAELLPSIYDTDPVVKFFGGNIGDIFRIKRKSLWGDVIAKEAIYYRRVIRTPVKAKK